MVDFYVKSVIITHKLVGTNLCVIGLERREFNMRKGYVGTYSGSISEGIYQFTIDEQQGIVTDVSLFAEINNSKYIGLTDTHLYSVYVIGELSNKVYVVNLGTYMIENEKSVLSNGEEDHTWFANWDQIYYSWTYVEELKKAYKARDLMPVEYEKGSKGPSDLSKVLDTLGK